MIENREKKQKGIRAAKKTGTDYSEFLDFKRLHELAKELLVFRLAFETAGGRELRRKLTEGEEIAIKEITNVYQTIELIISDKTEYGTLPEKQLSDEIWLDNYVFSLRQKKN